jgi:hypothetical protein
VPPSTGCAFRFRCSARLMRFRCVAAMTTWPIGTTASGNKRANARARAASVARVLASATAASTAPPTRRARICFLPPAAAVSRAQGTVGSPRSVAPKPRVQVAIQRKIRGVGCPAVHPEGAARRPASRLARRFKPVGPTSRCPRARSASDSLVRFRRYVYSSNWVRKNARRVIVFLASEAQVIRDAGGPQSSLRFALGGARLNVGGLRRH